jgi:hypothetical protein
VPAAKRTIIIIGAIIFEKTLVMGPRTPDRGQPNNHQHDDDRTKNNSTPHKIFIAGKSVALYLLALMMFAEEAQRYTGNNRDQRDK